MKYERTTHASRSDGTHVETELRVHVARGRDATAAQARPVVSIWLAASSGSSAWPLTRTAGITSTRKTETRSLIDRVGGSPSTGKENPMISESEDFQALWATESIQSGAPQAAVGALCAF